MQSESGLIQSSGILKDLSDGHFLNHLEAAIERVSNFHLAVDVGAHRGIWTRRMSEVFDEVVAFEPNPEQACKIDGKNVVVFEAALGARNGWVSMRDGPENTGQRHVAPHGFSEEVAFDGAVRMLTLDSLMLRSCDFLKIDTEGMEVFVLAGGINTIRRHKPVIIAERNYLCERYGVQQGDAGDLLESIGYKVAATLNMQYGADVIYEYRGD